MIGITLDDLVEMVTCPRGVADRGAAPAQGWLA
jgi:hypothetical protein